MTIRQHQMLNVLLVIYAIITCARLITNVRDAFGAGDFYVYWYAGHFMNEQRNPYLTYLNDEAPSVPVTYIDGETFDKLPEPWIVPFSPITNTSPYVLLTAPLARFNWFIAKWALFGLNLALAVALPQIALRVMRIHWSRMAQLTVHLLFFCTIGTRTTLVNGQNSLMILLVMLIALHFLDKRPWLVGILLGLALSKVSLIIATCLLLLYLRRFKPLFIAVVVQIFALLILSIWTNSSPHATLDAHRQIFLSVAQFGGIHLSNVSSLLTIPILIGTILLFIWSGYWVYATPNFAMRIELPQLLFLIFVLWSLLFAYHGPYDAVILLPVYLFAASVAARLPQPQKRLLMLTCLGGIAIMLSPGNIDLGTLISTPVWWPQLLNQMIAISMLVLLGWMLLFTKRPALLRELAPKSIAM